MPNPTLLAPLMLVAMLAPLPAAPSANDAPAAPSPQEAAAHADSKWEALALKKRASTQTIPGGVVCIGSSHMANWKNIQNDLKPLTVFNLGIGGSRMVHASEIFLPVLAVPAKPRAVILYEGSNDLNAGDTPEAILEHFKNLHQCLHRDLPETRLYVLGIVPSPGKRFEKWTAIQEANALLKKECASQPWMTFLDTTTPLIGPDGMPRTECFIRNDVHMTALGYETWASVIVPVVVEAEKGFEPVKTP
jgi:lysophospholipase L1-like esterase